MTRNQILQHNVNTHKKDNAKIQTKGYGKTDKF